MTDIAKLCQAVIAAHRMREQSWDGRMYVLDHFTCAEEVCHRAGLDSAGAVDIVAALAATGQGQDAASHVLAAERRKMITAVAVA